MSKKLIYANSKGQLLGDHTDAVAKIAKAIAKQMGVSDELSEKSEKTAIFHDFTKASLFFQNHISKSNLEAGTEGNTKRKRFPLHHEFAWALLVQRFDNRNPKNREIIDSVYLSHARPVSNKFETYKNHLEILQDISEEDITICNLYLDGIIDRYSINGFMRPIDTFPTEAISVPEIFREETPGSDEGVNPQILITKASLIGADRTVSAFSEKEMVDFITGRVTEDEIIQKHNTKGVQTLPQKPLSFSQERWDLQMEAAKYLSGKHTALLKASGGGGKTVLGILYKIIRGNQLFWMVPRNAVAEAVYENIIADLAVLNIEMSVELHYGGERKKANSDAKEMCSDIVVINIDTVLRATTEHRYADRVFKFLSADMVMDEFHEFLSDNPLYAAFVIFMRARHRYCKNSHTLLLSATDGLMNIMWDTADNKTTIYPDENSHMKAQHSQPYLVTIHKDQLPSAPPTLPFSVVFFNAVKTAQEQYLSNKEEFGHIVHSKFKKSKRQEIMATIMENYGRNADWKNNQKSVSSAIVLQAALDVSFLNVYDNVMSPESSGQRWARGNRHGRYEELKPTLNFYILANKSENFSVQNLYDYELRKLWFAFLCENFPEPKEATLDELYALYNKFNSINRSQIKKYLMDSFYAGCSRLKEYTPKKFLMAGGSKGKDDDKEKMHYKSLRNPEGSVHFTVQDCSGVWLTEEEVMSDGFLEAKKRFEHVNNAPKLMDGSYMNSLINMVKDSFPLLKEKYKRSKGAWNVARWLEIGRSPETPIIDFTRIYDDEIGLKEKPKT